MNRTGISLLLVLLSLLAGCKDDPAPCTGDACRDGASDGALTDASDANADGCVGPPGLYSDDACQVLADGWQAYEPKYWLWSDGLDKERFFFLPAGTQINTANPDRWVFPLGTRVYKHFIENGKRLETRLIQRVGTSGAIDDWVYRTFRWNHTQDAVTEVINGEEDVLGTLHDIPSQADCVTCHQNTMQDPILSVSAIQLNHASAGNAGMTLASLTDAGSLTTAISVATATIPGDATAQAALGYMNANCGHCHRPGGNASVSTSLALWAPTGQTMVGTMPAYTTAIDVCASWQNGLERVLRVEPLSPSGSAIWLRMGFRDLVPPITEDPRQMPRLGTEMVDNTGRNIIATWINSLPDSTAACPP